MSSAPRPQTSPSRSSPDHGSTCHSAGSASTVSVCERSSEPRPVAVPGIRATRFARAGSSRVELARDAVRLEVAAEELGRARLVPGRVDRVEADQLLEEPPSPRRGGSPPRPEDEHVLAAKLAVREELEVQPLGLRALLGADLLEPRAQVRDGRRRELPQLRGRVLRGTTRRARSAGRTPRRAGRARATRRPRGKARRPREGAGRAGPRAAPTRRGAMRSAPGARRVGRRAAWPRSGSGRARRSARRRRRPRRSSRPRTGAPGSRPRRIGPGACLRGRGAGFLELARREVEADDVRARPRGPQRHRTGAGCDIQHPRSRPGSELRDDPVVDGGVGRREPLVVGAAPDLAIAQSTSLAAFVISVRARQNSG